jgi:LPS export ABC transporter permease LptG/LPS export ABC transporter permease LptF
LTILDRYVIRQVLAPFILGLLVFTFLLIIPGLMDYAEDFIAKGASLPIVAQALWTLVPGALALTIPMALLLGLLIAFGKLSADREFVAMQACGVSLTRLLRPVTVLSTVACAATAYMWIVGMPAGNQRFREIAFDIVANLAEGEVRPRVFFTRFPDLVLYARDVPRTGGWNRVFLADDRPGQGSAVYLARHGRMVVNREKKTVELVLEDVSRHSSDATAKYEVLQTDRALLTIDPTAFFQNGGPGKGPRESSIPELRAQAEDLRREGVFPHNQLYEIQKKFSIPFGCLIFGLIGLALGATNRRDGTLASFVVGILVIFVYYMLLELGAALIKGQIIPPWLAAWAPNIILGLLGVMLIVWRRRVADQPLQLPSALRVSWRKTEPAQRGHTLGRRLLPLSILDRYVASTYGRVLGLSALAMSSIFYISTFIEESDKVFKGDATWPMFFSFLWHSTPQFAYYVIPLSVLLGTLITVALLTKSSELVVMKACGISLYRVAVPMVLGAAVAGLSLFVLEQTLLGPANRRAEELRLAMRKQPPASFDVSARRWVAAEDGTFYHYDSFDRGLRRFTSLSVYEFAPEMARVTRRTYAAAATAASDDNTASWALERGWVREFDERGEPRPYTPFERTEARLETASYFTTEAPAPQFMSYSQLRDYTQRLAAGGFDVVTQQVALARKLSFPFVTLVMTLIAVPFAVTIGRSGAMAGIGVGIAIAIAYWTTSSVFGALGAGGVVAPLLAAWAPNLLFGAGAAYMLLTVRT